MSKLILSLIFAAVIASAQKARIQITTVGEDGQKRSQVALKTSDSVLNAIDAWRQMQVLTPAVPEVTDANGTITTRAVPAVLRWPTREDLWAHIMRSFVISIAGQTAEESNVQIRAERDKIKAAQDAIEKIKAAMVN